MNTCVCLGKCAHSYTVGICIQCMYPDVAGAPVSYGRDSRSVSPRACTIGPASTHIVKPHLPCVLVSTCYCGSFYFSHPPGCRRYLALELTCVSLLSGDGERDSSGSLSSWRASYLAILSSSFFGLHPTPALGLVLLTSSPSLVWSAGFPCVHPPRGWGSVVSLSCRGRADLVISTDPHPGLLPA